MIRAFRKGRGTGTTRSTSTGTPKRTTRASSCSLSSSSTPGRHDALGTSSSLPSSSSLSISLSRSLSSSLSSSFPSKLSSSFPSKSSYKASFLSSSSTTSASETTTKTTTTTLPPRESMSYDVLIVGGGPAGLAASIRLKQLCRQHDRDLSVCVIEKGSEIGAHILSGNVFDPRALHELFPDMAADDGGDGGNRHWTTAFREEQGSVATPVTDDQFHVLTSDRSHVRIPHLLLPPQLKNTGGNYIVSLSQLCRWLALKAEELGVEIYAGFAASEVLMTTTTTTTSERRGGDDHRDEDDGRRVYGIATRDVGVGKDGNPKSTFERGVELHARQTLLAEGARGSCSEKIVEAFDLRRRRRRDGDGDGTGRGPIHDQTYGLGLKEVWEVPPEKHVPGLVQHTLGYPLQSSFTDKVFGGTFLYHQEPNLILLGMVVGLDYANPYLNPYREFQQWKTHPSIRAQLEGGACVGYGARVLNEGGYHAIPRLTVPGAALVGCAAGFLNGVKIKGTHTAMKSGMLAAEAAYEALVRDAPAVAETGQYDHQNEDAIRIDSYEREIDRSWIREELYQVRNTHEAFARWGVGGGLLYTGLATHITKGREPWTLEPRRTTTTTPAPQEQPHPRYHHHRDADTTGMAENFRPIDYPPPDGILTFDLLTNLQRSGTYHEEDQPPHLRIKPDLAHIPRDVSLSTYAGPEQRFCPAGVYEYVDDGTGGGGGGDDQNNNIDNDDDQNNKKKTNKKLVINAQNCIHCKCCSIKMPHEYIEWTVPEGGGGPQYQLT